MLNDKPGPVNGDCREISRGQFLDALDRVAPEARPRCAPSSQKLVLFALNTFLRGKGTCWPRQSTIAERCCLSRPTVNRLLAALVEQGLVHTSKVRNTDGAEWCVYSLNERAIVDAATGTPEVAGGDGVCSRRLQGGVAAGDTLKHSILKHSRKPKSLPHDDDHVGLGAQGRANRNANVVGEIPHTPPEGVGDICRKIAAICNRPVSGVNAECAHRLIRQGNTEPLQIDGEAVSGVRLALEALGVAEREMPRTGHSGGSERIPPSRVVQYTIGIMRNAHMDQQMPAVREIVVQSALERTIDAQERAHREATQRALRLGIEMGVFRDGE